jgi:transcriptional regulator with XRE-family HTH domain
MPPFDFTQAHKIIGERLRLIREERAKSITQASTEAGIAPKMLSKIEDGKANIRILTLCKLCKVYNVSLEKLLEDFRPGPAQGRP